MTTLLEKRSLGKSGSEAPATGQMRPTLKAVPNGTTGPWSEAAVNRRAWVALQDLATDLQDQQLQPFEILHVLLRQTLLWNSQGAKLAPNVALTILQALPGLHDFDPVADWQRRWAAFDEAALAEGIDSPGDEDRLRRSRARLLGQWLCMHSGSASAEAAVVAVEKAFLDHLEGMRHARG